MLRPLLHASAAAIVAVCSATSAFSATQSPSPCSEGWVFFDLGNTLIDTSDWDHLKYMPQAHDYLESLKTAGFHLGIISNVPESWGSTLQAKLAHLKEVVNQAWTGTQGFEWAAFESILLPPTDQERKPAPFLFNQARKLVPQCQIAYETDDTAEVDAALANGFDRGYLVGSTPGVYPPASHIFQSP